MISRILNKETTTYLIFGVLTTIVNFGTFVICNRVLGEENYLISNIFSFVAAVTFAFVTNKHFVFESKKWDVKTVVREAMTFVSARIFTFLLIEELGLWFAVQILKVSQFHMFSLNGTLLSKIALAFLAVLFNYILSKCFVFKTKEKIDEGNFDHTSL